MSDDGSFNDAARAAIIEVGWGRCIGCGRPDVTCQHRRARGMGGTSLVSIGHPANGVPLCGDGVRGCHGWTEAHPVLAHALGWRLRDDEDAVGSPFWDHRLGWRMWVLDPVDGCPLVAWYHASVDYFRVEATQVYRLQRPLPTNPPGKLILGRDRRVVAG